MLPLCRLLHHHHHHHQARSHYSGYLCSGPGNGSLGAGLELPDINYDVIKRELTPILGCRSVSTGQIQQWQASGALSQGRLWPLLGTTITNSNKNDVF